MSDNENQEEEEGKPFCIETAKQGRATCKKCKQKCPSGELRIAKLIHNPFGSGKMKQWFHIKCLFELFETQRPTTKRIENEDEIDGFEDLSEEEKKDLLEQVEECEKKLIEKWGDKLPKRSPKKIASPKQSSPTKFDPNSKDNLFREFRRLVAEVTNESSYLEKSAIIKKMLTTGSDGKCFKGDLIQWCRLLIPSVVKRIYNLQSKQLVKIFSKVFETDQEEMLEHLEQGDVGETIQYFFEKSDHVTPSKKSNITMQEVDHFLDELTKLSKEVEQIEHFKKIMKKCTSNDLKIIIRLIKHDLRMNAGAKHVLDAIHPDAYELFQSSRDLTSVINKIQGELKATSKIKATITVMTPVLPMLAEACKSVEQAMKKCPNGMYSEIKYDGERVQLHKCGNEFKYFSRSLKPVMPHKVSHFKDYIPQAFPHAKDLILDAEVLMVDTTTGKPLPFGTLGVHKKAEFKDASVCLFVFDCIYFNGEILTTKTMKERRRILRENMTEIKNHIMFSEIQEVHKAGDLAKMIKKVLILGLEGLVLKDLNGIYEPGKRHWLKVKKDYLCDGAMADSADLIVLGAWFGTGKKGGMMSVFLMGCYEEYTKKFVTVTKVHTGHDDKTLERLQTELKMTKISCDYARVPSWLKCTRTMVPDFVAEDPKNQPVWEITGAEFTQHDVHTADGISIRFPRVTKIRDDKTWQEATTLQELKTIVKNSKENMDFSFLSKHITSESDDYLGEGCSKQIKEEINSDEEFSDILELKPVKTEIKIEQNSDNESNEKTEIKKIKTEKPSKRNNNFDLESKYLDTPSKKRKNNDNNNKNIIVKKEIIDTTLESPRKNQFGPIKNRFPIIFPDVKIFLMDSQLEESDDIIRHFMAFGGDVLKNEQRNLATHVIYLEQQIFDLPKNVPKSARHVVFDWIKDSVGNGQIQDIRPYTVCWVPS